MRAPLRYHEGLGVLGPEPKRLDALAEVGLSARHRYHGEGSRRGARLGRVGVGVLDALERDREGKHARVFIGSRQGLRRRLVAAIHGLAVDADDAPAAVDHRDEIPFHVEHDAVDGAARLRRGGPLRAPNDARGHHQAAHRERRRHRLHHVVNAAIREALGSVPLGFADAATGDVGGYV